MLAHGSSWLDEAPVFDTRVLADAEGLRFIHTTARILAKRRAELSASQTQVAGWARVTRQTVAAIEDGTTWPDYLTVLKVAAALGLTLVPMPGGRRFGPPSGGALPPEVSAWLKHR